MCLYLVKDTDLYRILWFLKSLSGLRQAKVRTGPSKIVQHHGMMLQDPEIEQDYILGET